MIVLDASAVLAFLRDEPGADVVSAALDEGQAVLCAVTWAEVTFKAQRLGMDVGDFLRLVDVHPFTLSHAQLSTSMLLAGLSLGDRCCLAFARAVGAPVLTADRLWTGIEGVDVRLIR